MALGDDQHEPNRRHWISFWSLMGLQAQNAFNDKALQFTLLPLGVWIAHGAKWEASFAHLLGLLILFPFIAFAPVAGWIGDNFSKTRVIRFAAWMQLAVLLIVLGSFGIQFLPLGVFCFFLLAVQSTILSPAKVGIIKELVGSKRLGFASGVMEMFTILAILAGQILISFWFTARQETVNDGWHAGLIPMFVISAGALVTLVMAYAIQIMPARAHIPFKRSLLFSHFKQLGHLFHSRPLRLSALGVAYFWAFGAIVQFVSIQIARELYPDGHPYFASSTAWMMLAAGGGVAVGSVLAALFNKHHIELGLTPLGGIIMTVSILLLATTTPESGWFYSMLAGTGFGAAFFLVPVNAFLQDACDPSQRGNILAASNLLNCLAMALAVALQLIMIKLGLSAQAQFFLIGITVIFATIYVVRLLPQPFIRLLVLSTVRAIYRIDVSHAERMPAKGGVLLAPNHISYLDALILSAASPRPVRFLMIDKCFEAPLVGLIARLFDTVPISPYRAKEAIRVAAEALNEGSVVCIFPEGQLSRSGLMVEMKKGFALIARRAKCPVQPVYLDGLWKSIFSCERGRMFWKLPRKFPVGVRVDFGEPRDSSGITPALLKRDLNALAGEMFAKRREVAKYSSLEDLLKAAEAGAPAVVWSGRGHQHSCTWKNVLEVVEGISDPAELTSRHAGATQWLAEWRALAALPPAELRSLTLNALQVADPHDLGLGRNPVLIDSEAPETVRWVWGMLLPLLVKSYAVVFGPEDGRPSFGRLLERQPLRDLVGTERMGELLRSRQGYFDDLRWFRFDDGPQTVSDGEASIFSCYQQDGRIISLSMPHAPFTRKSDEQQDGWKEGSPGRLLTGFVASEKNGGLVLEGGMVEGEIALPGWRLDEKGFLVR